MPAPALPDTTYFSQQAVQFSAEFARIDSLPRRRWAPEQAEALAVQLTAALKTPNGTMTLWPVQAVALYEAWLYGGLFASMSVSAGKTLLSLLLARVLGSRCAVLILPAKLKSKKGQRAKGKTELEIQKLSKDWQFGLIPQLLSYEEIGPKGGKGLLESINPDLVILDEGHKVRNPKASRTRKLRHFLQANPSCRVCIMSGTTIKRALSDYSHLIYWALRGNSPIPTRFDVLQEWDQCTGEKLSVGLGRLSPGPLMKWVDQLEIPEIGLLNAIRKGIYRRLAETPGVICYHVAAEDIGAAIEVNEIRLPSSPAIEAAFRGLRVHKEMRDGVLVDAGWCLPNGQELVEGCEVYRHARTMALGFYLVWRVPAPKEWLEKRKVFGSFLREKLSTHHCYDSPDEVADAFPDAREVVDWKEIRGSYKPETKPVWIDGQALKLFADWLQGGGVLFVESVEFGRAVAGIAQVPYFGAGGLDASGQSIEAYHGHACVASVHANGEGRNLQRWSRMAICPPLPNGPQVEQTIGRMHRVGQLADLVTVDIAIGCKEHLLPFWQTMRDATLHKYEDGGDPKLLLAEVNVTPEDEMPSIGYAWGNVELP